MQFVSPFLCFLRLRSEQITAKPQSLVRKRQASFSSRMREDRVTSACNAPLIPDCTRECFFTAKRVRIAWACVPLAAAMRLTLSLARSTFAVAACLVTVIGPSNVLGRNVEVLRCATYPMLMRASVLSNGREVTHEAEDVAITTPWGDTGTFRERHSSR